MEIDEMKYFLSNELSELSDITGMYFDIQSIEYRESLHKCIQKLKLRTFNQDICFECKLDINNAIAHFASLIAMCYVIDGEYLYETDSLLYANQFKAQKFVIEVVDKFNEIYNNCKDVEKSINALEAFYETNYEVNTQADDERSFSMSKDSSEL